ncbi:MAG: RNA polymerase-associated protein rapA [Gammaproteobacteria bacterium]|nr:RNA polymerase-associated protein rapA [Gammaproteobacteria bacterium]
MIYDAAAIDDSASGGVNYKDHEIYTQNDYFRELYVDTEAAGWSWRLGKQQVVWGTADGIKLLDIINPTDFREVNQNVMEDSRIPIWMINAERELGDNGNFQVVVSQVAANKIPGLNAGGDEGHPFMMKGVDTITGQVNGFRNIAPALASTATSFSLLAAGGGFGPSPAGLVPFTTLTVDTFASSAWNITGPVITGAGFATGTSDSVVIDNPTAENGYVILNTIAQTPAGFLLPAFLGNNSTTALMDVEGTNGVATTVNWNPTVNPQAAFDHMPNATFSTFNTFSGGTGFGFPGAQQSMTTSYVVDNPDDEANAGFRWKNATASGINYSLNYFYHYDSNPVVDLSLHDATTGAPLVTELRNGANALVSRNSASLSDASAGTTTVLVANQAGTQYYGAFNPNTVGLGTPGSSLSTNGIDLRFTETQQRIHSLGAAFDMAVDQLEVPLVIRGEFLYDKDVMQPVVDKRLLSIGDIEGALVPEETDFFKYVLGADFTVMTNLLISAQFIQFINLDFTEETRTCTTQFGSTFDCSKYTADPTTMSVTNSLQKGWENKEFVSLFFSKPIGEEQLGRWNNITIWEEGNGWWNRLDAEYSLTDQFIVSGEWNQYWGDDNTTFGQLDESSNLQVGFKYIFEDY